MGSRGAESTSQPTSKPTSQPTSIPSSIPTNSLPTSQPTCQPTSWPTKMPSGTIDDSSSAPTSMPTAKEVTTAILSISQQLDGLDASEFTSNSNNSLAFKTTVANVLDLTVNAVSIEDIDDVDEDRRRRRLSDSDSITIQYEVESLVGGSSPYASTDSFLNEVTKALVDSTASACTANCFSILLPDNCAKYQASNALHDATVVEVTPSDIEVDEEDEEDDEDEGNGTTLLLFFFFAIAIAVGMYFY